MNDVMQERMELTIWLLKYLISLIGFVSQYLPKPSEAGKTGIFNSHFGFKKYF